MMPWITWGFVAALLAGREIYRWRQDRKLRRTLELLQWRERFARTRRDVVRLMACGEVSPKSMAMVKVYVIASGIVRRAADYRTFARNVAIEVTREANPDRELADRQIREIRELPAEAREVFARFTGDVHHLLTRYSWLYRSIGIAVRMLRALGAGSEARSPAHPATAHRAAPAAQRLRGRTRSPRHSLWPALQLKRQMYKRTEQWRSLVAA